jgi:hypothetical protein
MVLVSINIAVAFLSAQIIGRRNLNESYLSKHKVAKGDVMLLFGVVSVDIILRWIIRIGFLEVQRLEESC